MCHNRPCIKTRQRTNVIHGAINGLQVGLPLPQPQKYLHYASNQSNNCSIVWLSPISAQVRYYYMRQNTRPRPAGALRVVTYDDGTTSTRFIGDPAPRCNDALGIGECNIRSSHLCGTDPDSFSKQLSRMISTPPAMKGTSK